MSGSSKRPNWLDPDPTAGHELCGCGSGYVPVGTVCRDCEYKARLAEFRKFYSEDEAQVRAIVVHEYASRRAQARVQREITLAGTTIEARLVTTAAELQVWEATATTGDEVAVWLLVGPDPWQMYPAEKIDGAAGALSYYRMTR